MPEITCSFDRFGEVRKTEPRHIAPLPPPAQLVTEGRVQVHARPILRRKVIDMSSQLEKARANMSRLRATTKRLEPVRAMGAFAGGALVGALRRNGTVPVAAFGLPTTPLFAAALHLFAGSMSGTWASALHGAGDGMLGAYGFAAGLAGTLIAGDEVSGELIGSGSDATENTMLGLG